MSTFSIIGIIVSILLMCYLVYKGLNTGLATVVSACIVALCGGMSIEAALTEHYIPKFGSTVQSFIFMFAFGALFGSLMDKSGAADKFARTIMKYVHGKWSLYACMIVNMLLVMGGINAFIICFTVLPIYLVIFRELNIPRRLLPAAIWAGSAGFVSCSLPGVPSTINLIPSEVLGTSLFAALDICIVTSLMSCIFIYFYFEHLMRKARQKGENYVETEKDKNRIADSNRENSMPFLISFLPMIWMFVALNALKLSVIYAMGSACIFAFLLFWKWIPDKIQCVSEGWSGISVVLSVSACVAFGAVVQGTIGFQAIEAAVLNMNLNPLITLGIGTNVLAASMASGTGAVTTACQMLGTNAVTMGVQPELVHRVIAIASHGLDTLPHNSGVITYISACDCNYKDSYGPIFMISLVWPCVLTIVAILMGVIFY